MQVQTLREEPFPGWEQFRAALGAISATEAIAVVRRFTFTQAANGNGTFEGTSPVYDMNIHVPVKEWMLSVSVGDQFVAPLTIGNTEAVMGVLRTACARVNSLRGKHDALNARASIRDPTTDAILFRKLWFTHLEQLGSAWAPRFEIARSWRMFVEIWDELLASGRIPLDVHRQSAFRDLSTRLLLVFGLWSSEGYHPDVRKLMAETALDEVQLSTILEVCFPTLELVQARLADAPAYPKSIQNLFQRDPIVRLGPWGLLAPLPHLILQGWDLQNLFDTLEFTIANSDRSDGAPQFYRALGIVAEKYMQDLLREMESISSGTLFIEPFNFLENHESPDGFLHRPGHRTLVFESKCYRVPQRDYETVTLDSFRGWFANLLGRNEKGRLPLRQGHEFFKKWAEGNLQIASSLRNSSLKTSLYVIVSYEDVPVFLSMNRFRDWYEMELEDEVRDLWSKTLVISMRELEILAAAVRVAGQSEAPALELSAVDILFEYSEYRNTAPDWMEMASGAPQIKSNLGNWIVTRWPRVRSSQPRVIEQSYDTYFKKVLEVGFR
jgi:hypothetical protein